MAESTVLGCVDSAPEARTLVDILCATAAAFPEAAALDDGDARHPLGSSVNYSELLEQVQQFAGVLAEYGVGRGSRVGIRLPSGSRDLYIAILGALWAGAAYVPVDADDPEERADLVFGQAGVDVVCTSAGVEVTASCVHRQPGRPLPEDDAWIIFTSGSTGVPKGVAVTHRAAAAFVDAEARWFLADAPQPLGPDDRVLAGLSVAFDASCEEMWLAWRHGGCLVPAPRSLVRSGVDLGPWLLSRNITVVSTVPTLAGLWPAEALDAVRLLIFGGEACPPELVERLARSGREMWNTYGPTEATVVACGARLVPGAPVLIGRPLDGWVLAVVDAQGRPVAPGEVGELLIGGVGLARYLDADKDALKYAAEPALGWSRAYRSGDHVRATPEGLVYVGRVDDQVKIGGRRIELGEVEAAVQALPGVRSACVVVQTTGGGDKVLVGYFSLVDDVAGADVGVDVAALVEDFSARLAGSMPAALVPRLCVVDELPVTTSGKVDKRALPWPLPVLSDGAQGAGLSGTEAWVASVWEETLGVGVVDSSVDFFALGGTSLAAATTVARLRDRVPSLSVRDLYDHPRLGALAVRVEQIVGAPVDSEAHSIAHADADSSAGSGVQARARGAACGGGVRPVGWGMRVVQELAQVPLMTLAAAKWVTLVLLLNVLVGPLSPPVWLVAVLCVLTLTPVGQMGVGVVAARVLLAGLAPGSYPRGGWVHMRLWLAERINDVAGARSLTGAAWMSTYARLLGAKVGKGVLLHSLPPVTGMLSLGDYASVEPEVDLSGYWVEGDRLIVGPVRVGAGARVGARSTLLPGAKVGADAHVEAGSCIAGQRIKSGSRWSGSPALKVGRPRRTFPRKPAPQKRAWVVVYAASSLVLGLLPVAAVVAAAWPIVLLAWPDAVRLLLWAPVAAVGALVLYAAAVWAVVRGVGAGVRPGISPVHSVQAWRVWCVERVMDDARRHLFPLYAAMLTPWWLRALGARIGAGAEVSTAVMIPQLTDVRAGAFLADDTMIGGYELGGGWLKASRVKVGKRSFVGNSGIAQYKLAKDSLVAVLSATPRKSRAGSNWWGSPPERLRRAVVDCGVDSGRTYSPTAGVKAGRAAVETLRLFAPMVSAVLAMAVVVVIQWLLVRVGYWAFAVSGVVLIVAGAVAMGVAVVAKWVCVQRISRGEHPLWSPFVWLNELQDAFVESVAAPWFLTQVQGTGAMSVALRALGVRVGRGAWVESYWFPEADLCTVGAGATVNRGVVVQTHLFHDRIMSIDAVSVGVGATVGPHSVVLPAAGVGDGAVIGPASLVMRGDEVPANSYWQGNPIEPV